MSTQGPELHVTMSRHSLCSHFLRHPTPPRDSHKSPIEADLEQLERHMRTTRRSTKSDRVADRRRGTGRAEILTRSLKSLREQAGEQASKVGQRLAEQGDRLLNQGKTRTVDEITAVGAAIQEAADKLHDHNSETIAQYVETAAQKLEGIAEYISEVDLAELRGDAEAF